MSDNKSLLNYNKYGICLFLMAYSLFMFFGTMAGSVYAKYLYHYFSNPLYLIKILLIGSIYFNIFIYKTYNWKKFLLHAAVTIIILVISHNIKNPTPALIWLFMLGIHGINLKTLAKIILISTSIMFTIVTVPAILGLSTDRLFERVGAPLFYRHSFGFIDPNLFGAYLVQICMLVTYLRWKKFKAIDNVFLCTVLYFVAVFANSRASTILLILLILFVNLNKFWVKKPLLKFNYFFTNAMVILAPLFTFVMTKLYCSSFPLALWLDELSSCRFRNICYTTATNNITFWGYNLHATHEMNYMANLYGTFLFRYGVVALLLFLTGYLLVLKKAYLHKNIPLMIIIAMTMLQGISDLYPIMIYVNFSLLTFSCLLNNEDMFTEEKNLSS